MKKNFINLLMLLLIVIFYNNNNCSDVGYGNLWKRKIPSEAQFYKLDQKDQINLLKYLFQKNLEDGDIEKTAQLIVELWQIYGEEVSFHNVSIDVYKQVAARVNEINSILTGNPSVARREKFAGLIKDVLVQTKTAFPNQGIVMGITPPDSDGSEASYHQALTLDLVKD